ncbi:hypothetical protein DFJ58DRAFT_662106 [Suillus subalutaceus]|uniref:uncharacterized protein n=1 Tax=Suillus subalutaceus TaxID=48586 RepID=UPI001B885170|nr:uncharacterized protein DFJ58DRAFT_662106 [Suillus subalutaceus]KAG1850396.1 hypothetical protein DFJ58DRAFT_662106 [Suillus subalutaceus]
MSRRVHGELYKFIDSSDVILHILDAQDFLGTMYESLLEYMKKEKAHKHVQACRQQVSLYPIESQQVLSDFVYVSLLNVPQAKYIQRPTLQYPTIAFHAPPNHLFGKDSSIQLLCQFSQLHSDQKQISVGFVGYPDVGKSSVINVLKSGKVCRIAPVPREPRYAPRMTVNPPNLT